jgi:hypothetical protein
MVSAFAARGWCFVFLYFENVSLLTLACFRGLRTRTTGVSNELLVNASHRTPLRITTTFSERISLTF